MLLMTFGTAIAAATVAAKWLANMR
jgi:hypothetical protein